MTRCYEPRNLASAVVTIDSVAAVHLDPDGAIVVPSRNVRGIDLTQIPQITQKTSSVKSVESV